MAGILGLAFDHEDGHVRTTQGENFSVYLGSEATHEQLRNACLRIKERLRGMGRKLEDLTREEFVAMVAALD